MIRRDLMTRIWWRLTEGDASPVESLLESGFVAIDLETTGLDVRRDVVVAAAAIPFEGGQPRAGLVTLVNPGRPIPPPSTAIHGIDDAAVAGAPAIQDVLPAFDALCAGRIVVGHDVDFDIAVLARARTPAARPTPRLTLDTRRLARAAGYRDSRLEAIGPALEVPLVGRHTAEGDARMAGEILLAFVPLLRGRGVRTVADLLRLQRSAPRHD